MKMKTDRHTSVEAGRQRSIQTNGQWTCREIERSEAETPETPDKRLIDVFIISEFSDIEQR